MSVEHLPVWTPEQYAAEHAMFVHSPAWELSNVKRALSMFQWENTPEQWARLQAVTDIIEARNRRAAK